MRTLGRGTADRRQVLGRGRTIVFLLGRLCPKYYGLPLPQIKKASQQCFKTSPLCPRRKFLNWPRRGLRRLFPLLMRPVTCHMCWPGSLNGYMK